MLASSQLTQARPASSLFSSPHPTLLSVSLSFALSLAPATQKYFSRWEDWQSAPIPCVIKYLTLKICSDSLACTQPSVYSVAQPASRPAGPEVSD